MFLFNWLKHKSSSGFDFCSWHQTKCVQVIVTFILENCNIWQQAAAELSNIVAMPELSKGLFSLSKTHKVQGLQL